MKALAARHGLTMMVIPFTIRIATPEDEDAVRSLLEATYPPLMAGAYQADLLDKALPLMTRANSALLRSGSFYLAESPGGRIVGCGGWTLTRPGAQPEAVNASLGHIRHFATHPDWGRRGIGRAIFARCGRQARAGCVEQFECYSSLVAQNFYEAVGFVPKGAISIELSPEVAFPAVRMTCRL